MERINQNEKHNSTGEHPCSPDLSNQPITQKEIDNLNSQCEQLRIDRNYTEYIKVHRKLKTAINNYNSASRV